MATCGHTFNHSLEPVENMIQAYIDRTKKPKRWDMIGSIAPFGDRRMGGWLGEWFGRYSNPCRACRTCFEYAVRQSSQRYNIRSRTWDMNVKIAGCAGRSPWGIMVDEIVC